MNQLSQESIRSTCRAALVLTGLLAFRLPAVVSAESKDKKQPTAAEVKAYQKKLFKQLDQDHDKKLTVKEFVVAVLYDDFSNLDSDKDGRLTKDEFYKHAPKRKTHLPERPVGAGTRRVERDRTARVRLRQSRSETAIGRVELPLIKLVDQKPGRPWDAMRERVGTAGR